ncbi:MAG TPA: tetratricopeptide repeat protein [Gemmataceae bacterium]|nr:tetratricopeptide repeat protein [Gemmataceae bacterium]
MKRSSRVAAGAIGMMVALLATALRAQQPTKKADEVKPQWQRLLQGEDAKKAKEQENKLERLQEAGQFTEALKVAEALAELRTNKQGANHWEAVDARFDVEGIRRVINANKEEQQGYRRTFAMQREAIALDGKAHYREAQPLFEQLLAIRRTVLGEEHPDTASSYNSLALNKYAQGEYVQAKEGFSKALAIYRKVLGEEHPYTATSYSALAASQFAQGEYVRAEEGHSKALAIQRKVLGEEHPDTARSYNSLALNQYAQGKYAQAEQGFSKALAIDRKVLGEEHPVTARSYNSLALNQNAQGKYAQAEQGFSKALAIYRKVLGEEDPYTATIYNSLALNRTDQGKYAQAEENFSKALAIDRKVLGEEHPYTARSYNNLALNQYAQGKYVHAEKGFSKALAIRRKVLGEEHPETASSYNSLAVSQYAQGKYAQAEEGYSKALAIFRKVLGEEHPYTATIYNKLALNQYAQGKYVLAEALWRRAAASFALARSRITTTGLERAVFTTERSPLPALAAVLSRNGNADEAWQRFEESLARGTWDDLSARLRRPLSERDQQTRITANIARLNQRIDKINAPKLTEEQSKQRDQLLSQLRQAHDELAAFDRQLEKKYGPVAGEVFSRSRIQTSLAEGAVLLAWLDIADAPKAADPNGEHWAILLRSSGDPIWVRMKGSGDKSVWTDADTQLPGQLRAALQSPGRKWQLLAQRLRKQRLDPLAQHLKGVRRLIVLPSTALAGVPIEVIADGYTVSYAHSGTMYSHLFGQPPPTSKGLFVLADPVFDAPRENDAPQPLPPSGVLLTFVAPGSNAATAGLKPNDVMLRYGDTDLTGPKDFKPQPESNDSEKRVPVMIWRVGTKLSRPLFVRPGKLGVVIAQEPAPQAVAEQRRIDRLLAWRSGDDGKWPRLPGTRIEAASLQRLFAKEPSRLLLDSESSEQRLDELAKSGNLGRYRYVHLATHGEVNDNFPLRSAVILSRDHLPDEKQRTELLLSGQPIPDGSLTAEEALQRWNLHCDLVTLSACQTALGKYERGEGFVGFSQALILCGARSVCLSLWKVDDTATALLMERFYQNLLGKRDGLKAPMPKAAALAEAKAWLRDLPREEAIKRAASLSKGVDRGKRPGAHSLEIAAPFAPEDSAKSDRPFAHPYYWAAFVLVGHAD